MKTISDYIDSLFLSVPETSQTIQLKEDLLASAEDRYEDLKRQGKSENEAIGAVISEFGSIDELLDEMNIKQEFADEKGYEIDEITIDESIEFLAIRRKGATLIGLGVMMILMGSAALFASIGVLGGPFGIGFGLLFFFIGIAIGVPLFIIAGTSMINSNKRLDDRFIPLQVKNEVKTRKEIFQRSFVFCMVTGVILAILSLIPVVLLTVFNQSIGRALLGVGGMFGVVSFSVFFFIFGGVIMGSFTKLIENTYFISNENELGPRAKAERNSRKPEWLHTLEKVYWPIIVGIFLCQGFLLGNWGSNWIIFPVGAIAFGVLESIFSRKE
ncbi:permease prefix domain 1-containing protein [Enterococcus quebecensis]|uniref:Beta-carotene 15,15'-monooxygenase n=1 Tax=Enterococcus quebecensis TaxID=903983 RepID=A0A1E5H2R0_9ENTE|nr:permease prefix domain 1-containing protein [Enterococcus quebecensis]OEG19164.1 hypothetical protein BCR23_00285 [Enterococcus quebecensis]OJG75931.1 hypothetical protein RV12_GL000270 [Enterococcus quebecensis]